LKEFFFFPLSLLFSSICTNAWALKRERHDFIRDLYEKAGLKLVEKGKRKIYKERKKSHNTTVRTVFQEAG